jgi:hypothetical protein
VLEKYCTAEKRPGVPNSWTYVLEQPGRATEEGAASRPASPLTGGAHRHGSPSPLVAGGGSKHSSTAASLITKFTKVLSQEERAMVSLRVPY